MVTWFDESRLDDESVLALRDAVFQRGQKPLERERNFRNEAEVHLSADQDGIRGDESRIATHHLHETDAIARGFGFDVGG